MSERLITPPAALAVAMADAQFAVRADVDENGVSPLDISITQAVRTYTREAEHITGRAFINQTWRVTLDRFPDAIKLPRAPLGQVVHVKFYDLAGIQQVLDPQDYQVDGESEPGYVVPAPGRSWPATMARINAVEVECVCGYGPDDTMVPDEVKGYILACVQQQFAPVGTAKKADFQRLLDGCMVY